MWCVEYEMNGVEADTSLVVRYAADSPNGNWRLVDTVEFISNPGRDVWHFSIIDNGFGNLLCLTVEDTVDGMFGGTGADFRLYCAHSGDGGRTFVTRQTPLLVASASGWDESFIYRSDGAWIDETVKDRLELFYSASGQGGWHTGLTVAEFGPCCEIRGDFNHSLILDVS